MSTNTELLLQNQLIEPISEWRNLNIDSRSIDVYFDAFDVISTILGISNLAKSVGEGFEIESFQDEQWLVFALFLNDFLPTTKLLEPHSSEVLQFARRNAFQDYPHSTIIDPRELTDKFATAINIPSEYLDKSPLAYDHNINDENLTHERLFKFYSVILPMHWQGRFKRVFADKGHKKVDIEKMLIASILEDIDADTFSKCLHGFNVIRGQYENGPNNVNDALALAILARRLEAFKKGGRLPIFYDATGRFRDVIRLEEIEDRFTYHNAFIDQNVCIIKPSKYFVTLALIRPNERVLQNAKEMFPAVYEGVIDKSLLPLIGNSEELRTAIHFWQKIYESNELAVLEREVQKYSQNIEQFKQHWFFLFVWIPYIVNQTGSDHIDFIEVNTNYLNELNEDGDFVKSTQIAWNDYFESSRVLSLFSRIWGILYSQVQKDAVVRLYSLIRSAKGLELNVFRDYGLVRFALVFGDDNDHESSDVLGNVNEKLCAILYNELRSDDISTRSIAVHKIVRFVYDGFFQKQLFSRSMSLSLLWILHRYSIIDELCENYEKQKDYPHYSVAIIHCASIIESSAVDDRVKRVNDIIECINTSLGSYSYHVSVGLSYIYWKIFFGRQQYTFSGSGILPESIKIDSRNYKYINKAISLSYKAYRFIIGDADNKWNDIRVLSLLYALNMYIFSTTEGGSGRKFDSIDIYVNVFEGYRLKYIYTYWESRYDDTLARYYFRAALEIANKKNLRRRIEYERCMREARNAIERAIKNSIDHHELKEGFSTLLVQYERLSMPECYQKMRQKIDVMSARM